MSLPPPPSGLASASRLELLWYRTRRVLLQGRRLARWQLTPSRWPAPLLAQGAGFSVPLYTRTVPIVREGPGVHPLLEAGKLHNLRLAAPAFDGLLLAPHRPLSFWRTVGRLSHGAGYRQGLALRGGCLTPSLGGGVCLLANALFELAVRSGWHILERHGHTLEAVPHEAGTLWGLDATVAWPDVDLVVAPREAEVRLGVQVRGEQLVLSSHAAAPSRLRCELHAEAETLRPDAHGLVRANRIVRRITEVHTGEGVEEAVVAENCRRLLHAAQQQRNCFTCDAQGCHARQLPERSAR